MKYKVGDLVTSRWGNIDKLGYIVDINKAAQTITTVFFEDTKFEFKHTFSYFDLYYKVL